MRQRKFRALAPSVACVHGSAIPLLSCTGSWKPSLARIVIALPSRADFHFLRRERAKIAKMAEDCALLLFLADRSSPSGAEPPGRELFLYEPVFRRALENCSEALRRTWRYHFGSTLSW